MHSSGCAAKGAITRASGLADGVSLRSSSSENDYTVVVALLHTNINDECPEPLRIAFR